MKNAMLLRKKMTLIIVAALMLGMLGCGDRGASEKTKNEKTKTSSEDKKEKKGKDKEKADTGEIELIEEPEDDISDIIDSDEYQEFLNRYAMQFRQYSALCMEYPGAYAAGGFNDQTKCEMIGYSECMYDAIDSEGAKYTEDYAGSYIESDRVQELSQEFFNSQFDAGKALQFEDIGLDGIRESGQHAAIDRDGNIYVNDGDWGTIGPDVTGWKTEFDGRKIIVTCTIDMVDYEGAEPITAYELGDYTLTLEYDKADPYTVWVENYELNPAPLTLLTEEEAMAGVIKYYTDLNKPDGDYVIFDNETEDHNMYWQMTVRYQMSEEEEEERIKNGDIPLANVYVITVDVSKKSGICMDEYGERFKIEY